MLYRRRADTVRQWRRDVFGRANGYLQRVLASVVGGCRFQWRRRRGSSGRGESAELCLHFSGEAGDDQLAANEHELGILGLGDVLLTGMPQPTTASCDQKRCMGLRRSIIVRSWPSLDFHETYPA